MILADIDPNNIKLWKIDISDEKDEEILNFRRHKNTKELLATKKFKHTGRKDLQNELSILLLNIHFIVL